MATCFGTYIGLTSIGLAVLGVQAGNGWLAILCGALSLSMGSTAIVGIFVQRPLRSPLLGWSLIGIATMTVIDGDLYLIVVSVPIASLLVAAFVLEVVNGRSAGDAARALGSAACAILAIVVLAVLAPQLPAICPPAPRSGQSVATLSYPPNVPPWDTAERQYMDACP